MIEISNQMDNLRKLLSQSQKNQDNFLPNVYLVGGAVRDLYLRKRLNYDVLCNDRDYVVTNLTANDMLNLGFSQVGNENAFPVFIDDLGNEFALARTEKRKNQFNQNIYHDFDFNVNNVTIEEDLLRRDLTINSMASKINYDYETPLDNNGHYILDENRYLIQGSRHSLNDLKYGVLRQTGESFIEDPIRILRACRFLARKYYKLDDMEKNFAYTFELSGELLSLMTNMVNDNMLTDKTIPMERFFKELDKGLSEPATELMILGLKDCGALKHIIPELDNLSGVPQPEKHHPEIDSFVHSLLVVQQTATLVAPATESISLPNKAKFASLLHDLGKGLTPKSQWPRHIGHDIAGIPLVENVCNRLKVPTDYKRLALLVCEYHHKIHNAKELSDKKILEIFKNTNALRDDQTFKLLLQCCKADARGRLGFENQPYPQADYLSEFVDLFKNNENMRNAIQEVAEKRQSENKKQLIEGDVHKIRLHYIKQIKKRIHEKHFKNENSVLLDIDNQVKQEMQQNKISLSVSENINPVEIDNNECNIDKQVKRGFKI